MYLENVHMLRKDLKSSRSWQVILYSEGIHDLRLAGDHERLAGHKPLRLFWYRPCP